LFDIHLFSVVHDCVTLNVHYDGAGPHEFPHLVLRVLPPRVCAWGSPGGSFLLWFLLGSWSFRFIWYGDVPFR